MAGALATKELSSASAMAVIEANSGRLLYNKNENQRLPMASTTKILTAIVALENCDDLDKKYEIPVEAVGIEGSSIYLKAGEHLSVRELLYGLMLRSGNDSAVAIAILVGGSVENFVELMNKKIDDLGLVDTHIVTVNGLHDDDHYTTAYELAKITAYALDNETFCEISKTQQKTISNELDKKSGYVRVLKNKNKFLNMINGADGVKIGYTQKAGRCLVSSATRGDMKIVCVVLNCRDWFNECANLTEKAFSEFKMYKLLSKGTIGETDKLNIDGIKSVPIILNDDVLYPLKKDEILKLRAEIELSDNVKLPHKSTEEIGTIKFMIENDLIFSRKIYTIELEKIKEESFIKKIIKAF